MVSLILICVAVVFVATATFVYGAKTRSLEGELGDALDDIERLKSKLEQADDCIEALRSLMNKQEERIAKNAKALEQRVTKDEFADWATGEKAKLPQNLEQGFENMLSYDPFRKGE